MASTPDSQLDVFTTPPERARNTWRTWWKNPDEGNYYLPAWHKLVRLDEEMKFSSAMAHVDLDMAINMLEVQQNPAAVLLRKRYEEKVTPFRDECTTLAKPDATRWAIFDELQWALAPPQQGLPAGPREVGLWPLPLSWRSALP